MSFTLISGISGGVDSAAASALLKQANMLHCCVMLRLTTGDSGCCSLEDSRLARLTASRLKTGFYYIDVRDRFETLVIKPYVNDVLRGITPNPCIWCNARVRFPALMEAAEWLGAAGIATGHYARLSRAFCDIEDPEPGDTSIRKSSDKGRDQSYVLYSVARDILSKTFFPLGEFCKEEARQTAGEAGLPSCNRNSSQDLCFIEKGQKADDFIRSRGFAPPVFRLIDTAGVDRGKRIPVTRLTPGMRRGLGISSGCGPLYVLKLIPDEETAVIGPRSEGMRSRVTLDNLVVHRPGAPDIAQVENSPDIAQSAGMSDMEVTSAETGHSDDRQVIYSVSLRYRGVPVPGRIKFVGSCRGVLQLLKPVFAPAPGQHAVLYRAGHIVAGGTISRV